MASPRGAIPAIVYLLGIGLAGVAWWIIILALPAARGLFVPDGVSDDVLLALLMPDALLFCGGAIMAAIGLMNRCRWAYAVLCVHAGAAMYAALLTISWWAWIGGAGFGALLMTPPLLVSVILVWQLHPEAPHA